VDRQLPPRLWVFLGIAPLVSCPLCRSGETFLANIVVAQQIQALRSITTWDQGFSVPLTRNLNAFLREICGLKISPDRTFAAYPASEQRLAVAKVVAMFPAMTEDDAQFHLYQAVTIYA
jgi:hypothetical protein